MSNVIVLPVVTTERIDPERIVKRAAEANLQTVVVLGTNPDGTFYCASSEPAPEAMLHLEKARIEILKSLGPL